MDLKRGSYLCIIITVHARKKATMEIQTHNREVDKDQALLSVWDEDNFVNLYQEITNKFTKLDINCIWLNNAKKF